MRESDLVVQHYKEDSQLDPNNTEIHYELGVSSLGKEDMDAALSAFKEVARLDPECADVRHKIGGIYRNKEEYAIAIESLKESLRLVHRMQTNWRSNPYRK